MSSVDDLEELIATRRLHGLDDNLFKEETMTEETFNDLIDNFEVIENLTLYGRTIIKTNVRRLQLRIKELEKENTQLEAIKDEAIKRYNFESIPVQKIKDLMEKEKLPLTIVGGRGNCKTLAYGIKLGKIKACEELLEEK